MNAHICMVPFVSCEGCAHLYQNRSVCGSLALEGCCILVGEESAVRESVEGGGKIGGERT